MVDDDDVVVSAESGPLDWIVRMSVSISVEKTAGFVSSESSVESVDEE